MLTTKEYEEAFTNLPDLNHVYETPDDEFRKTAEDRSKQDKALLQEWKNWLGHTYAPELNTEQQELIFQQAWDRGESQVSMYRIEGYYELYVELIDTIFKAHTGENMETGYMLTQ